MKNIIYLAYFFLKSDYRSVFQSLQCAHKRFNKNRFFMLVDMIYCSMRYGASFVDYFNFQFFVKDSVERASYATMGDMYLFHQQLNDVKKTHLIDDKSQFFKNFHEFSRKPYFEKNVRENNEKLFSFLRKNIDKNLVFKLPDSTAGRGVKIERLSRFDDKFYVGEVLLEEFIDDFFTDTDSIYIEEFLEQHNVLQELSPSAVNTVRVITILDAKGFVEVIGAVLRISVNSSIDNYSQGNIAAEVDVQTGVVLTGGIQKQSACADYLDRHPVTGMQIKNLQLPHWDEVKNLAKQAAKQVPSVRTVGWDVAILEDEPVLIEGNSKWNKDTWQIPAGVGKKALLQKYMAK